ncbi:unnamed protein product [Rotaria sordida]|uniref:protein disulfide-isomerase n=1 Tax=Rotaria sordida TaxID=392033 RepID=A0A814N719_9BILA|nr:unnamed protein product [Rotaria sordida]
MHRSSVFFIIGFLISTTNGFYSSNDDVVELDPSNFDRLVMQSSDLWIVEFYAPWCGHCQNLVPEWKRVATALKGIVKIGAVDADTHKSLGQQYGISGFPTIKIFGSNKRSPTNYPGGRTADAIIEQALNQLRTIVNERLGKRTGGGSSGSGNEGKDTIELTDSNFDSTVIDSEDMWLVEFMAPWCGHCKNLAPEWARAAIELKGKVKLGVVDATVHTQLAQRYGIQGFPTIKFFPSGRKDGQAEEYDGGRTSSDIVAWALDKFQANVPAPDVLEITNQAVLDDNCAEKQLCIISFLPNILDCQSTCRNEHLTMLKNFAENYKRNRWGWLWVEAFRQQKLEDAVGIGGFGYPAQVAINTRKGKYAVLKGAFSQTGISSFLKELSAGRLTSPLVPLNGVAEGKLPTIIDSEPWDGQDGKLDFVEDIDLSDVNLDDDDDDDDSNKRKKVINYRCPKFFQNNLILIMQSLSVYARLFARAISSTEAEHILFNGLLRLSSSTVHTTQTSNNLAITYPSTAIKHAVHLVTVSSGYSSHDNNEYECIIQTKRRNSLIEQKSHPSNVYGDDAFFITKHRLGDFLGVADGVGGWREHGIDPSLFSRSLMDACKSLIDNKLIDLNPSTLKELLSKGYKQLLEDKQCIIGSSTACIVALHNEERILHTANLGDSGFVVIRKNTIVHRSQEQQHYFNSPFQLAIHPTVKDPRLIADSPDLASVTSFHVEENDFIVIATDGLWDNLPDATILAEIKQIKVS